MLKERAMNSSIVFTLPIRKMIFGVSRNEPRMHWDSGGSPILAAARMAPI